MASLVAQGIYSSCRKYAKLKSPLINFQLTRTCIWDSPKMLDMLPQRGTIKNRFLIDKDCESLPDRWYLRNQKPYHPPPGVESKLDAIVKEILGEEAKPEDVIPDDLKFPLLAKCWKELFHAVPNPLLHTIKTVSDVREFYKTEIVTKSPYQLLMEKDLPPNLHIIEDYDRYNPDSPSKLFRISAYPGRSTIVTGLKARKKYKSNYVRLPYNYYNEAVYGKPPLY